MLLQKFHYKWFYWLFFWNLLSFFRDFIVPKVNLLIWMCFERPCWHCFWSPHGKQSSQGICLKQFQHGFLKKANDSSGKTQNLKINVRHFSSIWKHDLLHVTTTKLTPIHMIEIFIFSRSKDICTCIQYEHGFYTLTTVNRSQNCTQNYNFRSLANSFFIICLNEVFSRNLLPPLVIKLSPALHFIS